MIDIHDIPLLNDISIAHASQVPMSESFCVVCRITELFCSFKYEQGRVNDSVTSPSQMNAYVRVQLLNHTNTCIVPENHSAADLSSVLWPKLGSRSVNIGKGFPQMLDPVHLQRLAREWKDFLPHIFDFCIRMLLSMRMLDHMNMYNHLGKVQLTRCRDPILTKKLMLKPSLGVPSATWDYHHLTNLNITMSVNQDREARETNHTLIASLWPY